MVSAAAPSVAVSAPNTQKGAASALTARDITPAPSTPPLRGRKRPNTPPGPAHGAYLEREHSNPTPSPSSVATRSFTHSSSKKAHPTSADSLATPRRGREIHARHAHLASPPASPARNSNFSLNTPRRSDHLSKSSALLQLHNEHRQHQSALASTPQDAANMMPTPSKTPVKRRDKTGTSRILNFHTEDPNDLMPRPRKIKSQASHEHDRSNGFGLYDDDVGNSERHAGSIDIFTDANARIPEVDHGVDNPFIGPPKTETSPRRRSSRIQKNAEQLAEEAEMDEAAARGEGMVFTFRGKKVFRPFDNVAQQSHGLDDSLEQRTLRRSAGFTTDRPFTRSQIQPRLLFPPAAHSFSRNLEHELNDESAHVDSEADTDIESETSAMLGPGNMPISDLPASVQQPETPVKSRKVPNTPPTTAHRSGRRSARNLLTTIDEDAGLTQSLERDTSPMPANKSKGKKAANPFDSWQRTKSRATTGSGSVKRGADAMDGSSAGAASKRTRSTERSLATP